MNVVEEARQSYEKIQKNLSSQLEELYATLLRAYETDFGLLVEQNSCVQTFQDYNKFLSEREETYTREEFLFPAADDSENYQKQIAALTFAKNALNLKDLEADLLFCAGPKGRTFEADPRRERRVAAASAAGERRGHHRELRRRWTADRRRLPRGGAQGRRRGKDCGDDHTGAE